MIHQIAAGLVPDGIALARRYEEVKPGHHLGVLALAADALRKGESDDAREILGEGGTFVGQVMAALSAFGDGDVDSARAILVKHGGNRPPTVVRGKSLPHTIWVCSKQQMATTRRPSSLRAHGRDGKWWHAPARGVACASAGSPRQKESR